MKEEGALNEVHGVQKLTTERAKRAKGGVGYSDNSALNNRKREEQPNKYIYITNADRDIYIYNTKDTVHQHLN